MSTRILLETNEKLVKQITADSENSYSKGLQLLKMLSQLGYEAESIESWAKVEQHFIQDYPKATLTFNLQANGVNETLYLEAKAFHHAGGLSFTALTDLEKETIAEKHRVHAETADQIEVFNLIEATIANFNRLDQLNVKMSFSELYATSRIFSYDRSRPGERLQANKDYLISAIKSQK